MNISHDNESAKMLMFIPFKQLRVNVVKFKNLTLQNFVCLSTSLTAIMAYILNHWDCVAFILSWA